MSSSVKSVERRRRVDDLTEAFGLQKQANTIVGTPIRKGISGGQKRRLSIASALITAPKILFLDEPTSGLDSTASYEVMKYLRAVVQKHKVLNLGKINFNANPFQLIVVASIHQPSSSTFALFDKLLLLSEGTTCFSGHTRSLKAYFSSIDIPVPTYVNPAEYLIDLVSTDFALGDGDVQARLSKIHNAWKSSAQGSTHFSSASRPDESKTQLLTRRERANILKVVAALLHRNFIKSYRDVVAYGIRFAMYVGLAIMMGTVWLRLSPTQSHIQPFINAIVSQ